MAAITPTPEKLSQLSQAGGTPGAADVAGRVLRRLECAGYRFHLLGDGGVGWCHEGAEAGRTSEGDALAALLEAHGRGRCGALSWRGLMMSDGAAIWLGVYEQWEGDPDPARDAGWVEQLATIATLHGLPCYEDGVSDSGAAGWRRLVERYRAGEVEAKREERKTQSGKRKAEAARVLPWDVDRQTIKELV